jgi:hypothetical protein
MHFSTQVSGPTTRGSKLVSKRSKIILSDCVVLENITRTAFIAAFLSVHGLSEQFSPGVHSGPAFKLYWTGSVYVH